MNQAVYKNMPTPLGWSDVDSIILTGSHAHGTVIDDNDVDVTCVINAMSGPALFGFNPFVQKRVTVPSKDGVIEIAYISIKRLIELLCGSKIAALEILFSPLSLFLKDGEAMKSIQEKRKSVFTVRNIGPSLMGYAEGQLAAMDHARPNGTNSKRSLALDQFGYDTKAAVHAVRAFSMCMELFTDGYIRVDRTNLDADLLKEIKQGKMKLDEVTTIVLRAQESAKFWYERSEGGLPEEVDRAAAEELLVDISMRGTMQRYFSWTFSQGLSSGIVPGVNRAQAAAERFVSRMVSQNSTDTDVGESTEIPGGEKSEDVPGGRKSDEVGVSQNSLDVDVGKFLEDRKGSKSDQSAGGQYLITSEWDDFSFQDTKGILKSDETGWGLELNH